MAWEKKYKVDLANTITSYLASLKTEKGKDIAVRNAMSLEVIAGALLGIGERIEEVARLLEQKPDPSTAHIPSTYVPSDLGDPMPMKTSFSSSESRICTRCSMTMPLGRFAGASPVCNQCVLDTQKDQS